MPPTRRSFWRRRVLDVVLGQLRQGITPQKIALTIAIGLALGVFPILGATTLLCLLVGVWLHFNQPILQLVNWLAAPLQIPAIYFFIRIGEHLTRTPPLQFSIQQLLQRFKASPSQFLQQFGVSGLRGILAWALIAPPLALAVYWLLLAPLRRAARPRSH